MRARNARAEAEEAIRYHFPNESATYYFRKFFHEGGCVWERLYEIARQHPINFSEGRLARYFIEGVDCLWNCLMDYIYHSEQPDLVPVHQMQTMRRKVERARTRLTRRGITDYLGPEAHALHCVDMEFTRLGIDLLGE